MGLIQKILMCRPTYFKVAYEINPWMHVSVQANNQTAHQQWDQLHRTLTEKCGAKVELVDPVDGLPDMVFTANAGLVRKNQVYLSKFRFKERQREREYFEKWFKKNGFQVNGDEECSFEGAGDALFAGNKLFAAFGFRTDARVYKYIFDKFRVQGSVVNPLSSKDRKIFEELQDKKESKHDENLEKISLIICELVDPRFYHIDTCFCPVTPSLAIWHPKAFSEGSRKYMEREIELIAVPEKEALRFACNSVAISGKHVVIPGDCPETAKSLEKRGFQTYQVPMTEFLKAGGACKCLTLNVTEGLQ